MTIQIMLVRQCVRLELMMLFGIKKKHFGKETKTVELTSEIGSQDTQVTLSGAKKAGVTYSGPKLHHIEEEDLDPS